MLHLVSSKNGCQLTCQHQALCIAPCTNTSAGSLAPAVKCEGSAVPTPAEG